MDIIFNASINLSVLLSSVIDNAAVLFGKIHMGCFEDKTLILS